MNERKRIGCIFLSLVYMYTVVSCLEWVFHKYVMHGEADKLCKIPCIGQSLSILAHNHLSHHKGIDMDMNMEHHDDLSFFCWKGVIYLSIASFIMFTPVFQRNILQNLSASIIISLIFVYAWNNMHNDMHHSEGKISWDQGVPNNLSKEYMHTELFELLLKHHSIHHLQKGENYNFNVICLGFDWLMGTKKNDNCFDNEVYCAKNDDTRCDFVRRGCL
jgi:hypothetical protein